MESNSKTDRRRLLNLSMRVVVALVMVGLLVIPIAVQADLKATAVVYAWDIVANKFQNSNIIIAWDGSWVPFLHELNFDTDNWAGDDPVLCEYDPANPETTGTRWAGNMYYTLYHVDNAPDGAPGFQESRLWSLISCDRNGDGSFDGDDLVAPPPPNDRGEWRGQQDPLLPEPWGPYAECNASGDFCYVDETNEKDVEVDCTSGHCKTEIVTTIRVNLDQDCDGDVDQELLDMGLTVDGNGHPEMLCFYAEARTPTPDQVAAEGMWGQTLQARIETVGGEKTVSFAVDEPTEHVPGRTPKLRRWYEIVSLKKNPDGTSDITIKRFWWGAKEAASPTLYDPENCTRDGHVRPLKYVIAPGSYVYDVSEAVSPGSSQGMPPFTLYVAPYADRGTPSDFAPGDPIEQAIGPDPFKPQAPSLAIELPLYFYLFGALLIGVLIGGLAVWMGQGRWRKTARVRAQEVRRWQSEASRLARERDAELSRSGGGKDLVLAGR